MAHTIRTLGDYIGMRYTVTAYCNGYGPPKCEEAGRGTELDLKALAEKHGADLDLTEITSRLRCKVCGAAAFIRTGHDGRPAAPREKGVLGRPNEP